MLKEIKELAVKMENLDNIKKELKRVQSVKCRLKKQKKRDDYETKMSEVVNYEQALKEAREYYEPKKITVTQMTKSDIEQLTFDETIKAIKSIQSKKCNTQYDEDLTEYNEALRIEEMLKEHRENVKPIEDTVVKKSDINNMIQHLENQEQELDKDYVLELLKKLNN